MNNIFKIFLSFFIISCSSQKKCMDVNVILPENYSKNYIVIFYNQKSGTAKEIDKNGNKVLKIPDSGILYTQDNPQVNCMYKRNTYISNNESLKHIPDYALSEYNGESISTDSIYTFSGFFTDKENFGYDCGYYFLGTLNDIKGKNGIIKPLSKTKKMIDSIAVKNRWNKVMFQN